MSITNPEITKRMTFKFFGNDPYVCQQFLNDLIIPEPPYPAPDIIIQIAVHLREFSWLFYSVITELLIAYLFYRLGKREGKKSQEDLKNDLHKILNEHQKSIADCLQNNEISLSKFKKLNLKKIYIRVKPDMKSKWESRLQTYSDKAKLLLKQDDETIDVIIKLFEELEDKNS